MLGTPLDTSFLSGTSARSSEAMQIRKHTTLASNRFRFVRFIASNSGPTTLKCTKPPQTSANPTEIVGGLCDQLQTNEILHCSILLILYATDQSFCQKIKRTPAWGDLGMAKIRVGVTVGLGEDQLLENCYHGMLRLRFAPSSSLWRRVRDLVWSVNPSKVAINYDIRCIQLLGGALQCAK